MTLTDEQKELRRTGISSTDLPSIVAYYAAQDGKSVPFHLFENESALATYAEKVGKGREYTDTVVTKAGRYLEPALAQWYADEKDCDVVMPYHTYCGQNTRHLATPDAFAVAPFSLDESGNLIPDPPGIDPADMEWGLEIKTAWTRDQCGLWSDTDEGVPVRYYMQVQWCMHVTGLNRWDIAVLLAGEYAVDFRIYEIERSQKRIDYFAELADRFLSEHVDAENPPEPDGSRAAMTAITDLLPEPTDDMRLADDEQKETIQQLVDAKEEKDRWEKEYRRCKQTLAQKLDDAQGVEDEDGRGIRRDSRGSIRPCGL